MKKLIPVLVVMTLVLALLPVCASADTPSESGALLLDESELGFTQHETITVMADTMELVESSVFSLSPITPSNTTGLTSIVLSLIGNYDPVVVEYRYQNNNSTNYSYLREVQPDYPWLVSAGIFAIVLFCSLRILGGAICKK